MTDLEMTKLCAEALGATAEVLKYGVRAHFKHPERDGWKYESTVLFNPLHDDAQAMALVKKFRLYIDGMLLPDWTVAMSKDARSFSCCHVNLNRAVVECVAKMQTDAAIKE